MIRIATRIVVLVFVLCAVAQNVGGDGLSKEQAEQWRGQIRSALFVPTPLPPLEAKTHGQFEPESGIVAERVTYASQYGLRVPAILYLPKERKGKIPALIVVNGHGGDKYRSEEH